MGCINEAVISGNLVRQPEIRATQSGTYYATFSVAVNEGTGDKKRVSYFDCVRWLGQQPSEALQRFWSNIEKGRKVAVKARLRQDRWEQDGSKRSKVELIVEEFETFGRPSVDPASYAPGQQMPIAAAPPQVPQQEVMDEDIPF